LTLRNRFRYFLPIAEATLAGNNNDSAGAGCGVDADFTAANQGKQTDDVRRNERQQERSMMTKALDALKRFAADEEGTALMEYTILLGILVVAVIVIIEGLGTWIGNKWCVLAKQLNTDKGGLSC
jgi:pilus assembly protein Flp/PilA